MGRTPAETRRISLTRPRLSVAARVSERWPPEGPRGLEGRARAPVPGLPEATRAASPDAAASNFSNLGVRSAASEAGTGILPVLPVLRELMPRGGLPRGSVVTVAEFGLLALALAAGASAAGAWCGIAGVPEAGVLAAAALGLETERTLLVPDPGHAWAQVVASLLDGCELVLLRLPERAPAAGSTGLTGPARLTAPRSGSGWRPRCAARGVCCWWSVTGPGRRSVSGSSPRDGPGWATGTAGSGLLRAGGGRRPRRGGHDAHPLAVAAGRRRWHYRG